MKGIAAGKPLVIVSESKADGKAELVQVPHLQHLAKLNMGQKLRDDGTEEDQEMETSGNVLKLVENVCSYATFTGCSLLLLQLDVHI